MAEKTTRFRLYRNQNKCECCSKQNLPEPIVFAKCSRLDGTYVCDRCYADHNNAITLRQNRRQA